MRDMTRIFNDDRAVENIYSYLPVPAVEFLPHGVTINDARLFGKWLVIIDATQVDEGNIRKK